MYVQAYLSSSVAANTRADAYRRMEGVLWRSQLSRSITSHSRGTKVDVYVFV